MNKKLLASLACLSLALSSCSNQDEEREVDLTLLKTHSSYTAGSLFVTMDFDSDGNTKTAEYRGITVLDKSNVQQSAITLYDKNIREIKPGTSGTIANWKKIVPYITKLNHDNEK